MGGKHLKNLRREIRIKRVPSCQREKDFTPHLRRPRWPLLCPSHSIPLQPIKSSKLKIKDRLFNLASIALTQNLLRLIPSLMGTSHRTMRCSALKIKKKLSLSMKMKR